ncbi:hypothetical protein [Rhodococcus sp. HNM0569]|uniref:hypothetical protein n=1 Tax=Rhodococcus sp. HNM0569 TaxID=2716340 RepID=UPI00146C0893|nr:hypothetical protein [Rhodococcus sp. HNM0569]NLU82325.1 hypothetical protein [Rhodococcus sp. HNM0569]
MNSASQSEPSAAAARALTADIAQWSRQGRRMATPSWFVLLCVSISILAWIPASLLLGDASHLYWYAVAPLSALVSGWYYATRPAQPAAWPGLVGIATGAVMLVAVLAIVAFVRGDWADAGPWLVLGSGLGVFASSWRSPTLGAVAAATLTTVAVVAVTDPAQGQAILALVVGVAAALGAAVDLVRAEGLPRSAERTA